MYNMNGPPKGYNTTSDQSSYDLVFKDIIVKSENRNPEKYPNPNSYTVTIGEEISKIYKAEIISVNVPAATDTAVNVSSDGNRLYFKYNDGTKDNYGYIKIQAGTYLNPPAIAFELQRQLNTILGANKIVITYNTNLNRYVFVAPSNKTFTLYPVNGFIINSEYTVTKSISESLHLYIQPNLNVTKPINIITNKLGLLEVVADDVYGSYNGVSMTTDEQFGNTIVSDLVLTNCSIYLSLGNLNSNTIKFVSNENPTSKSNISSIFCQIPNNTAVSSVANKTLLNEPAVWSGINFYNPPLSLITKLDVAWYNEYSELINNICEQCFTLRLYYFQKRNAATSFSVPITTFAASGTVDSLFANR